MSYCSLLYKARTANTTAANAEPKATPVWAPLLAVITVGWAVGLVPLVGAATVAMVVSGANAAPVGAAGTAAGVPATRAGTGVVWPSGIPVEKVTSGTVMTVERTLSTDDEGTISPDDSPAVIVAGTWMVVMTVTAVLPTAGAWVASGDGFPAVVGTAGPVGAPVTIAGLDGI